MDRPAFDAARPLAFMHIPKTGGMSLSAALTEALRPCAMVGGFDRVLLGPFDDFASLDARHCVRDRDHVQLRERTMLRNVTRHAPLMAVPAEGN